MVDNLARVAALRGLIRHHRPDVIVGMIDSNAILALLAAQGTRTRVIAAERTYPPLTDSNRPWRFLRWLLYRFADGVTVQTVASAAWMRRHVPTRRLAVIPNAIHLPLPAGDPIQDPLLHIPEGTRVILNAGRLVPLKGQALLIRSVAPLLAANREWMLVIAGEGPERAALVTLIESLGMAGRIMLVGAVGNMADWYQRAEIFVLSSRFEGFPNALLEAMAHGCACVSLDIEAGPRDLIELGLNGLLVDPAEATGGVKRAVGRLLEDESLRNRLSATARSVVEKFAFDRIVLEWEDFISPLPKKHRSLSDLSAGTVSQMGSADRKDI